MKKNIVMLILAIIALSIWAEAPNWNSIESDGVMPKDGSKTRIQAPRYLELRDSLITGLEHLDENTFATVSNWYASNDFDQDSLLVSWTFADTARSYLTQDYTDFTTAIRNGQSLLLTYDVNDSTTVAGGTVSAWITGICDSLALNITAGTSKTLNITSKALADTCDFVLWVKPDDSVTAGKFAFDNLYLTSRYESPVTIANGADVTLYTPENAIELVIDPKGYEVKIEIGSSYYLVESLFTIPVTARQSVTIANDSGASITLYFYYNKI